MLTGTVIAVERRQNSVDGNPRWNISFDGITYRTAKDAQFAFDIDDSLVGRRVHIVLRMEKGEPCIIAMERMPDTE